MKVVLVQGAPRSGTTVIGRAIAVSTGLGFIGEAERGWNWRAEGRRCGCGALLGECEIWGPALLGKTPQHWLHHRIAVADLVPRLAGREPTPLARKYVAELGDLYGRLSDNLGTAGVVDTSKYLRSVVATCSVPDVDLLVVHVFRDPRGALHSRARLRQRRRENGTHARPRLAARSGLLAGVDALTWLLASTLGPTLSRRGTPRRLRVSYESFCRDPNEVLGLVGDAIGLTVEPIVRADRTIELPTSHSAGGNSHRFSTGVVAIREDTAWRTDATGVERLVGGATHLVFSAGSRAACALRHAKRSLGRSVATVRP